MLVCVIKLNKKKLLLSVFFKENSQCVKILVKKIDVICPKLIFKQNYKTVFY